MNMTLPKAPVTVERLSGTIQFDYIKGSLFRVIHVDGVHGGLRPDGQTIHMALFNERNAIPQHEEFNITNGRIGEPLKREGRDSIVREVEVDAIMDLGAARALRDWLANVIIVAEAAKEQLAKEQG